jgi:hypothetical protein
MCLCVCLQVPEAARNQEAKNSAFNATHSTSQQQLNCTRSEDEAIPGERHLSNKVPEAARNQEAENSACNPTNSTSQQHHNCTKSKDEAIPGEPHLSHNASAPQASSAKATFCEATRQHQAEAGTAKLVQRMVGISAQPYRYGKLLQHLCSGSVHGRFITDGYLCSVRYTGREQVLCICSEWANIDLWFLLYT